MSKLTITAKHPVRKAIAELPDYYDSLGAGVAAVSAVCAEYNLRMEEKVLDGNEGWTTFALYREPDGWFVCSECEAKLDRTELNNCVAFSWYRARPGRWECIKYVS